MYNKTVESALPTFAPNILTTPIITTIPAATMDTCKALKPPSRVPIYVAATSAIAVLPAGMPSKASDHPIVNATNGPVFL